MAALIVFFVLLASPPTIVAHSNAAQLAQPLLLEANQGEERQRRVPAKGAGSIASSSFILKVDSRNGGASALMLLTERIKPEAVIPKHRHLHQDEIVVIEHGTVHAVVGNRAGDVHDGGTIFIPHNTWVTIKNVGTTTIDVLAFFNGSDFDTYMRCASVPKGQRVTVMTASQRLACARAGGYQLAALQSKPQR